MSNLSSLELICGYGVFGHVHVWFHDSISEARFTLPIENQRWELVLASFLAISLATTGELYSTCVNNIQSVFWGVGRIAGQLSCDKFGNSSYIMKVVAVTISPR